MLHWSMHVDAMMPPIPRADTTKPMDWHIVTDMAPSARWAGPQHVQASTSWVWGRQPGQKGLLAGGTAYVTDGSQERSGARHTNLPFPFICFGEIISLARYQEPFVTHGVNASCSVYLLPPGRGAASTGRWGPAGSSETARRRASAEATALSRTPTAEMLKSDETAKNYGVPNPFLAGMMLLSQVERCLSACLYLGMFVEQWIVYKRREQIAKDST